MAYLHFYGAMESADGYTPADRCFHRASKLRLSMRVCWQPQAQCKDSDKNSSLPVKPSNNARFLIVVIWCFEASYRPSHQRKSMRSVDRVCSMHYRTGVSSCPSVGRSNCASASGVERVLSAARNSSPGEAAGAEARSRVCGASN